MGLRIQVHGREAVTDAQEAHAGARTRSIPRDARRSVRLQPRRVRQLAHEDCDHLPEAWSLQARAQRASEGPGLPAVRQTAADGGCCPTIREGRAAPDRCSQREVQLRRVDLSGRGLEDQGHLPAAWRLLAAGFLPSPGKIRLQGMREYSPRASAEDDPRRMAAPRARAIRRPLRVRPRELEYAQKHRDEAIALPVPRSRVAGDEARLSPSLPDGLPAVRARGRWRQAAAHDRGVHRAGTRSIQRELHLREDRLPKLLGEDHHHLPRAWRLLDPPRQPHSRP